MKKIKYNQLLNLNLKPPTKIVYHLHHLKFKYEMYLIAGKQSHWEKKSTIYFLHFADDQLMTAQDYYDDVEYVTRNLQAAQNWTLMYIYIYTHSKI